MSSPLAREDIETRPAEIGSRLAEIGGRVEELASEIELAAARGDEGVWGRLDEERRALEAERERLEAERRGLRVLEDTEVLPAEAAEAERELSREIATLREAAEDAAERIREHGDALLAAAEELLAGDGRLRRLVGSHRALLAAYPGLDVRPAALPPVPDARWLARVRRALRRRLAELGTLRRANAKGRTGIDRRLASVPGEVRRLIQARRPPG